MSAATWALKRHDNPIPQADPHPKASPAPVGRTLSWTPSEEASKRALGFFTAGGALIGVVGFSVSFDSVMLAARPYLGMASWCVPVMVDLAIFVLTGLALFMELHDLGAKWIRLVPNGLSAWTLYLNTATQHTWFGKAVHAVGPALWVVTVEIAAFAVRKLIGLSDEKRIEGLRRSLWILRPFATWRIWRQMRIHQITTYTAALDRDAARAAVLGQLRLHHGRMWRQKAPLAQRIALRLQGRDPAGVAAVLTAHQTTADLLAGTVGAPVPSATSEPVEPSPENVFGDVMASRRHGVTSPGGQGADVRERPASSQVEAASAAQSLRPEVPSLRPLFQDPAPGPVASEDECDVVPAVADEPRSSLASAVRGLVDGGVTDPKVIAAALPSLLGRAPNPESVAREIRAAKARLERRDPDLAGPYL